MITAEVARNGFALVDGTLSNGDPWLAAAELFGAPVLMVERQPIRARADGRSYASTALATPLHTDSQLHHGLPPDWQVLACIRPADDGGDTLLLDTWPWLEAQDDARLFTVDRRIPFVFGDVLAPTVALAKERLVFTHSPMPPRDAVAHALALTLPAPQRIHVGAGQILIVDNHRMLHGRTAFHDTRRELLRLLVWLPPYRDAPAALCARARSFPDGLTRASMPVTIGERERAAVAAMLRGEPPGLLAHRLAVPEAHLYAWRDLLT
jgi:gamma-butyrobetaine dioxygenase